MTTAAAGPTTATRPAAPGHSSRARYRRLAATAALGVGMLVAGCAADGPDVVHVRVTDTGFDPGLIEVAPGTEVRFWSNSTDVHTVTSRQETVGGEPALPEGAAEFDSGRLREGESFAVTFEAPGDHVYWCEIHRDQQWVGVIRVGES